MMKTSDFNFDLPTGTDCPGPVGRPFLIKIDGA